MLTYHEQVVLLDKWQTHYDDLTPEDLDPPSKLQDDEGEEPRDDEI